MKRDRDLLYKSWIPTCESAGIQNLSKGINFKTSIANISEINKEFNLIQSQTKKSNSNNVILRYFKYFALKKDSNIYCSK